MKHRAFSLIELVIVVALIGIIAAIAAPRYGQAATRYRVKLAAGRVAEELRFASEQARALESRVVANVDTVAEQLSVSPADGARAGEVLSRLDLSRAPYEANILTSLRGVTPGSPAFDARGLADADAEVAIMAGTLYAVVRVQQGSGVVAVSEISIWGGGGGAKFEAGDVGVIDGAVFEVVP
ncbi:MAG: prepilin-type N-terminal cleavage/methylation domain-containing protein [Phycisphaerales bacterium]